jgi:ribonuclease D
VEGDSFYRYGERLCLDQVAFGGAVHVHDPQAEDLGPFFRDLESRELVLHGSDFDLRLLHARYGFAPERVFDTMLAARFLNIPKFGLSDLYERYFGLTLEKKPGPTGAGALSEELLAYARKDVERLEELGSISPTARSGGPPDWHAGARRRREDRATPSVLCVGPGA